MPRYANLPQLLAAQDWAAAEAVLRAAARKKAPPPEVFYNLAKVLEAAGKPSQIAVWLKRAVKARPDYGDAWFELGRFALVDNDLRGAFDAFKRAHTLVPEEADARDNLGRVALRLGEWQTAAECFDARNDDAAMLARYRIAAETGADLSAIQTELLARRALRPEAVKAMTRTAKGSLPRYMPPLKDTV